MTADYEHLEAEIVSAAKKAFEELQQRVATEHFYAFALYSDDSAETILPAANTEEGFKKALEYYTSEPDKYDYGELYRECRWDTAEWVYEAFENEHFEKVYEFLQTIKANIGNDSYSSHVEKVHKTMTQALKKLEDEKYFGDGEDRENITVFATISDSSEAYNLMIHSAKLANPETVYNQFKTEIMHN